MTVYHVMHCLRPIVDMDENACNVQEEEQYREHRARIIPVVLKMRQTS
jgi:hypothetical protein